MIAVLPWVIFILCFRYFHIMNWAILYRLNPLKEVMPNLVWCHIKCRNLFNGLKKCAINLPFNSVKLQLNFLFHGLHAAELHRFALYNSCHSSKKIPFNVPHSCFPWLWSCLSSRFILAMIWFNPRCWPSHKILVSVVHGQLRPCHFICWAVRVWRSYWDHSLTV